MSQDNYLRECSQVTGSMQLALSFCGTLVGATSLDETFKHHIYLPATPCHVIQHFAGPPNGERRKTI